MSHVCNKPARLRLGRAGATTLEFAVVALVFLTVLIGCMDLGRYYLIEHSLRTLVAETARVAQTDATLNGSVPTTSSFALIAPFGAKAQLNVSQNSVPPPNITPSSIQITVTGTYPFTAWSPIWSSLNGTISEQTVIWY
jgi:Flp pilus assembly protein TadG